MKRLIALVLLVPACLTDPWSDEGDDHGGGGGGGSTIVCPHLDPSVVFDDYVSCGEGVRCPTAVGGRREVTFDDHRWRSTSVEIDGVFAHEPIGRSSFFLHATAAGSGRFVVRGVRCLGRSEEVVHDIVLQALPVAQVRVRTSDQVYTYNPASPYVSYLTDRIGYRINTGGVIELVPPGAGVTAPPYVVDSSIQFAPGTSPEVRARSEHSNLFHVLAPGVHQIVVAADSFGGQTHTFQIHAFDQADRIEARMTKLPARAGDTGTACFYAFAGEYEIAMQDYTFDAGDNIIYSIGSPAQRIDNCLVFTATSVGTGRITVSTGGLSKTIEFPMGPAS